MEKPITIKIKEFDEKICNIINTSRLPMWKVRDELDKIRVQVIQACEEEEKEEKKQYEDGLIAEQKQREANE